MSFDAPLAIETSSKALKASICQADKSVEKKERRDANAHPFAGNDEYPEARVKKAKHGELCGEMTAYQRHVVVEATSCTADKAGRAGAIPESGTTR